MHTRGRQVTHSEEKGEVMRWNQTAGAHRMRRTRKEAGADVRRVGGASSRVRFAAVVGLAAYLAWHCATASAQTSSLFGSTQGRSSGTAAAAGLGAAAGALGSAGRTVGSTGTRGATAALNTQAGTSASVDTTFSGGFVGRSDNLGRFVGRQEAGTQRASGATNFGAFQFGAFNNAFRNSFQPGNNTASSSDPRSRIRVQQRLAFDAPKLPVRTVSTDLQRRLSLIGRRRPVLASVRFEIQYDGRIRLTGKAPDEHQKRLAELLVRMEPGVREVVNDIAVAR
ncbi:MAG: BON domain-containing protein [Planctomycetota bacterium]|nr:MAG: BON domain-containing protein [Planctomycetota bacterium]